MHCKLGLYGVTKKGTTLREDGLSCRATVTSNNKNILGGRKGHFQHFWTL